MTPDGSLGGSKARIFLYQCEMGLTSPLTDASERVTSLKSILQETQ